MFRKSAGAGLVCAAMMTLLAGGAASAQDKSPSDKSVQAFMRYAWALLPEKFTPPNGKTITVDKKKPETVEVPIDVAREAVKVGYYSAHAQLCNLWEEQQANFDTLMLRQRAAKKWNDQQLLFIQKLHQVTVMLMTGKVMIVEKEGNVTVAQREAKTNINASCTDADRQQVKARIASYINATPVTKTANPAASKAKK